MAIPAQYERRHIYHFTHIANIPSILQHGLLAKNKLSSTHTSIASESIQTRRDSLSIPVHGKTLHDYVPLYFCSICPMFLSVVIKKIFDQRSLVYIEFPISIIENPGVLFTDIAANSTIEPQFYDDCQKLTELDWDAIDYKRWSWTDEVKRKKMAEALIPESVHLSSAARLVVWNRHAKNYILTEAAHLMITPPEISYEMSKVRPHFFKAFMHGEPRLSIVPGPIEIRGQFTKAVNQTIARRKTPPQNPLFGNLQALLNGLKNDFYCLDCTEALGDLEAINGIHTETVDLHTQHVVKHLQKLECYQNLDANSKIITQISAYLHDIGKGVTEKLVNGKYMTNERHPLYALPLVARLLAKEVLTITEQEIRKILFLVCYHDFFGDLLKDRRSIEEIVNITQDEQDIHMLYALCCADSLAISSDWFKTRSPENFLNKILDNIRLRND